MGHMKFPLPQNIAPEESVCIQVMVPADTEWLAVFWGWFWTLCSARNHQDDPSHTAMVVAAAWREIYEQARASECGGDMDVRQNEETPCILEKQVGETWTQFADLKLCPPQIRIARGVVQFSTDGGTTWQNADQSTDDPDYDPRNDAPLNPYRTGSNIPCLAAANATACFVELHREIVEWYNDAVVVLIFCGAISAILQIFFGIGWASFSMTVNYMTYVNAMLGHTGALTVESFTTTIQDELTCILYCRADENGQWDQEAFEAVISDLSLKTGDMWELIKIYVASIGGYVGLNNAGTTTSVESHDCNGCPCSDCPPTLALNEGVDVYPTWDNPHPVWNGFTWDLTGTYSGKYPDGSAVLGAGNYVRVTPAQPFCTRGVTQRFARTNSGTGVHLRIHGVDGNDYEYDDPLTGDPVDTNWGSWHTIGTGGAVIDAEYIEITSSGVAGLIVDGIRIHTCYRT